MVDFNLTNKFEAQPTPENAQNALDDLLLQLEESQDEEEQRRIKNSLPTLRRSFSVVFSEFLDTAITHDLEDFGPWLSAAGEFDELDQAGIEQDENFLQLQGSCIQQLVSIMKIELDETELKKLLRLIEEEQSE